MTGILKNKAQTQPGAAAVVSESTKEFREQVLKNTKLNALLTNTDKPTSSTPPKNSDTNEINADARATDAAKAAEEQLKWNKQNLNENAVIQKQILENMETTIDEPKTPFQVAHPGSNEYYQDDDDDDLNNFSLGEPEIKLDPKADDFEVGIHDEPSQAAATESAEQAQHHKSFGELRKKHYHQEHIPTISQTGGFEEYEEDDNDDDGNDEPAKPKMSFAELRKLHYQKEHVPVAPVNLDDDEDEDQQ